LNWQWIFREKFYIYEKASSMIRFTKQQLVNSVLAESSDLNAYLNAGGLPANERESMDNEFYREWADPVYDDLQYQIDWIKSAPIQNVMKWAFDNDLSVDQMKWLEHYRGQLSLEKVKLNLAQNYGTTHLNTRLYQMMKERHLNSEDSLLKFSNEVFLDSLPHL
jgi:hypothetical protein